MSHGGGSAVLTLGLLQPSAPVFLSVGVTLTWLPTTTFDVVELTAQSRGITLLDVDPIIGGFVLVVRGTLARPVPQVRRTQWGSVSCRLDDLPLVLAAPTPILTPLLGVDDDVCAFTLPILIAQPVGQKTTYLVATYWLQQIGR